MKNFKKGDFFIICFLLLFSFLPLLFLKNDFSSQGAKILVTQDSKILGEYALNKGEQSQYIDFIFYVQGKSYQGRLETKEGKVRLLRLPKEAVPKGIHADMSWIENDSKVIVALPAKLVISIQGNEERETETETEVDSIAN